MSIDSCSGNIVYTLLFSEPEACKRRLYMNKKSTMRERPILERPYEKCMKYGSEVLTDAELLAVIIRTGTRGVQSVELSQEILSFSDQEPGLLGIHHLSVQDLMKIRGIGKVKAIQIKCIAELSIRIARASTSKGLCFQQPKTIAAHYMEVLRHEEQEKLLLLSLNTKNYLICEDVLSIGTVNATLITPRELFIKALRNGAVNLILLHNHPSGDPKPSKDDLLVTKRIQESGKLLGVGLLDHIIIGDHLYLSFKEQGII